MFIDYEILKLIWWLFIGVLLAGFAVMDGQDMGVGTLLPFIGKNDDERRVMINSVAPHWDGNQVWFITGGGAASCRCGRTRASRLSTPRCAPAEAATRSARRCRAVAFIHPPKSCKLGHRRRATRRTSW